MEICTVIGSAVFAITLLLSFLWLIGSLFKNVGVTYFNPAGLVFYIAFPFLCFWMEGMVFDSAPHAWGVAIIPIVLNLYFLFLQYVHFIGSMIIGKRNIYRIGHAFIIRKYTFDKIKKCSGNYSSGIVASKVSRKKVTTFTVQVRFSDGTQGEFSTNHKDTPKARYFLDTIKAYRKK